ncbi:MAG TPA: GTP-binding protein [Firmicutes bacterium]|nr:GTP-binding protein [Bacillota bacterium]
MIKIDIFSGFLGAGKTTLIRKLIQEVYKGEKVVLIENEFGEIGVDGGFLKDAGIQITEMNSGCICCTLVGDFAKALREVAAKYAPDRIVIEPSGVGKLSDVIRAVQSAGVEGAQLNAFCSVVDAKKCKMYLKNFGEFFLDQVENAGCIVLSHTGDAQKVSEAVALLREHTDATIVTTDWKELSGKELLAAIEQKDSLKAELEKLARETAEEHHHEHGEHCCHDHGHEHEDGEHCCHDHEDEEHDHEHGGHCCHDHEHGHEHGEHCGHHHHHADEVFASWGTETNKAFTKNALEQKLEQLDSGEYGQILRAKGIVEGDGEWLYFDYVPGEPDVRTGAPGVTGRLCVIGCRLNEEKLKALFLE